MFCSLMWYFGFVYILFVDVFGLYVGKMVKIWFGCLMCIIDIVFVVIVFVFGSIYYLYKG